MSEKYGLKGRYRIMKTNALLVDDKYQRGEHEALSAKIAAIFMWSMFGVLIVSRRKGSYFIIDGQHRFIAACLLGIEDVPCMVFKDLALRDEAAVFSKINGLRQRVHPIEMWKADLEAEDPLTVETQKTLVDQGYRISYASRNKEKNGRRALASVALAKRLQRAGILGEVLHLMVACWPDSELLTSGVTINGVSVFLSAYRSKISAIKQHEMQKRLRSVTLEKTFLLARNKRDRGYVATHGHGLSMLIAIELADRHNKGLLKRQRVEDAELKRLV